MREIARWITISGKHIPIFKGESVKEKFKKFYKDQKIKHSFENLSKRYQEYVDEYDKNTIMFPTNVKPEEIDNRDYDIERKYGEITAQDLEAGPVFFVVYGKYGHYYYAYKDQKAMMKNWETYGGLSQIVGTGKNKVPYGVYSAAGVGEYYLRRDKWGKGGWTWQDADGYKVKGSTQRKRVSEDEWHTRFNTKYKRQQGLRITQQEKKIYKAGDGNYMLDLPIGWRTGENTKYITGKTKKEVIEQLRNNTYRIW